MRSALLPVVVALAVRMVPVLTADRITADVERYRKVAAHVLDVSWNPYTAPRLYPYPPVWVWAEAGSEWAARRWGLRFAVLVKVPVLAADLGIVALLGVMGRERGLGSMPAWFYALHPVSVLVSGFHGQFDAIMLLLLLLSLVAFGRGRSDASALALAGAIAVKSFPVVTLPFFLLALPARRERARFLALATLPVVLLLVPYAVNDLPALRRELFGYGGVADFGWIGLVRGLTWLATGELARSEARHWNASIEVGRWLFLAAFAALVYACATRRLRPTLVEGALVAFMAFLTLYGAISAQYLLWVVPLGLLVPDRHVAAHGLAATAALVGFYTFLAPGVLWAGTPPLSPRAAGTLWVAGVGAVLAAGAAWLVRLVALARRRSEGR
jgi:hypothetical protein